MKNAFKVGPPIGLWGNLHLNAKLVNGWRIGDAPLIQAVLSADFRHPPQGRRLHGFSLMLGIAGFSLSVFLWDAGVRIPKWK